MKPASFEYRRPESLDVALDLLSTHGDDAKVLAGGQSLMPMMNLRLAQPAYVVDINRLSDLDYIKRQGDELVIGALARHNDIKDSDVVRDACPLICDAYDYVANPTVRNWGTLCGNLCHADPASEMTAVMVALDATLVLRSKANERTVSASDFFEDVYATAMAPDELLVEVRIPAMADNCRHAIEETSVRKGDFAMTLAVAILGIEGGNVAQASLVWAGVSNRPIRLAEVEERLVGNAPSEALCREVAEAAVEAIEVTEDPNADADYRRDLIRSLTVRALLAAAQRAA